jgi:hypothetical protein
MQLLSPTEEIMLGIPWGNPEEFFTPAFWATIAGRANDSHGYENLEGDLRREICFCLLGGFGVKAEVNRAAYLLLSKEGIFEAGCHPTTREIEKLLRTPLSIEERAVRYRFPHQKLCLYTVFPSLYA